MIGRKTKLSPEKLAAVTRHLGPVAKSVVEVLVALDLLEMESPADVHQEGVMFIEQMVEVWSRNHHAAIFDDLDRAGYRIVRK
jgi:hypothetical protein